MQTKQPKGLGQPRRPGELVFNLLMVLGSLYLLWSAYGISGFEALSAPGAVPMVTTAVMLLCTGLIFLETLRKSKITAEKLERDILPMPVIVTILAITGYALALKPLGFLPTSFLFLTGLIRYLAKYSLARSALLALLMVAGIYLLFRIVFTVLMPPGIVPEAEVIAWVKSLFVARGN
ncbi:tripartite tricarboxylate transporter TctB family protein [Pseudotabrizicola sp.]|uniref:tripartite tricarboxylate transporter TctB family protein n=3 Tax=Pseudotabrizicola sp. TaxID=2939647 RepID=UPI002731936C|nr:tripartite tricarboxylate transporter TctB family protein [Pseudotabrizicola sp.]MDP2080515.1 tripartite tricarboxylate transporter TctB family protein [Pseudotabrizicola sp.]